MFKARAGDFLNHHNSEHRDSIIVNSLIKHYIIKFLGTRRFLVASIYMPVFGVIG